MTNLISFYKAAAFDSYVSGGIYFNTTDHTVRIANEDGSLDVFSGVLNVSYENGILEITNGDNTTIQVPITDASELEDAVERLEAASADFEARLTQLEESNGMSEDVEKATLKMYKQLGKTNSTLKPLTDELRETMLNVKEFASLGTGLFIHWGVYSVPAGNYTGEKVPTATSTIATKTSTNYNTEWIMRDLGIPKDVYKNYENQFTATDWDPESLCKAAADAGMGYVIITIKHHEGFCLAPSKYGSWDVTTSAARNTIIDELVEACKANNLRFGIYYSQYWDWMAEGGFGLNHGSKWCSTDPYTDAQHTAYCKDAALQIQEMIEKYKPYVLWYDPGTNYAQKYKDIFIAAEDENYPNIITNDRLDYNRSQGDFGTGERTIYVRNALKYGESCFTMNDTWGYSDNNESKYFGIEKVMKQFMIYSLSYGQNCLMNIGPKADGSIPATQLEYLGNIKDFVNAYGSFRNYKRFSNNFQPKWGYAIELEGNKVLCYIVTKNNPSTQNVVIDCINTENLESVDILTPGTNASYEIQDGKVVVNNLALDTTTKIGVVRLNYSDMPAQPEANRISCDENVPSRVFLMAQNASWDFSRYTYSLKPSAKIDHKTAFIWEGDTANHLLELNYDILDTAPISEDDTITVTITDESGNVQTVTFAHDVPTSATLVALENGKRYSMVLKCSGTNTKDYYRLNSFKFAEEVIIIHPESVSLDMTEVTLDETGSAQLTATVLPADATDASVTWESSNTAVATVEDGMVHAVAPGESTITVKTVDGNKTATCIVTVEGQRIVDVERIELDNSTLDIKVGQTSQLTATVIPDTATYKNITWESSDETIATVADGLVTALTVGNVTITAKSAHDNTKTAQCAVTITAVIPDSVSLNKTEETLIPGFGVQLEATVLPVDATDKSIIWTSSDDTLAEVDENGYVFAKAAGAVTITATTVSGNKTASCNITVNAETYDRLFEAESLNGTSDQGTEWDYYLFNDENPNWTIFGFAQDSRNTPNEGETTRQTDSNATLYQCVVSSSPWTGLRVDANNNQYPIATSDKSTMYPRFLAGTDHYINPLTGDITTGKGSFSVNSPMHPVAISRDGLVYKSSIDGVNWTELTGIAETQIARLLNEPITVSYDYKRSGGQKTTTKYRFLRTDNPVCVAIKSESEYPFYTLYHTYDANL